MATAVAETMAICRYFEESYPLIRPTLIGVTIRRLEKHGLSSGCAGIDFYLFYAHGHVFSSTLAVFQ